MAEHCPPVLSLKNSPKETCYNEIGKYFTSQFGSSPCYYARVPGRVNLIGEHIDYCGFSVLPMAIEQEIVLAVGYNDSDIIKLINFDSDKYDNFSTSVHDLCINTTNPRWYYYFLCGYKRIAESYELQQKGLDVVVKGTIPPSAGLSSSSALVCASALATSFANRISLTKMEMATLCAFAEHYIGTQGGGMDQAIGFLAEPGTAKLIDFNPLKANNVQLPKGVAFVVANSCVEMNKAASSQFNIRVVECRLAAKVLAKTHELNWQNVEKLAEIPVLLNKKLEEMSAVIECSIPHKLYSRKEICSILKIDDSEFSSLLSKNTQHLQEFKIAQRAKHVFEEATRVKHFKMVCDNMTDTAVLDLGRLMNESHYSCRDLYECSHPNLDDLVKIALDAGALGSRLTGAGWGGCCVSLVMENKVHDFMNYVKKEYYENKLKMCSEKDVETAIFLTRPSGGAAVYSSDI